MNKDMTVEEWLGKDNNLGANICKEKYIRADEIFPEMVYRICGGNEEAMRLVFERKFLPAGRTITNRGTSFAASLSNCYSSGYAEDDYKKLLELNMKIGLTYKYQGGQGISLSKLRPKGAPICGGEYHSDGVIPFMELFNQTTLSTSQGGSRKGALMMSLDCWHKEIEDFIHIKSKDGAIEAANLSVEIDDEFMSAIKEYFDSGSIVEKTITRQYGDNNEPVTYTITPIEVYRAMMRRAYDWGDPGCIFTEQFRNHNMMQCCDDYMVVTGNPCTTGDTLILTDNGYVRIDSVVNKLVNVWNGYQFSEVKPIKTGENQEIVKITFSNGSVLKCTPYHKFILRDGKRVEAKELKVGAKLKKHHFPVIQGRGHIKNAYTQGFFSGDGFSCADRKAKYISFYGDQKKVLAQYCATISSREKSDLRDTYSVDVIYDKLFVPNATYSVESRLSWLAGLCDSDGSFEDGAIQITSVEYDFLMDVKNLLNTLGVDATLATSKAAGKKAATGENFSKEYNSRELYKLTIASSDVLQLNRIGFAPHRVSNVAMPDRDAKRFISVVDIEELKEKANVVYCFNEPINHSGIFNGVLTANCGEQPLATNAACNLGSINLSEFVLNPFLDSAKFDMNEFISAVRVSVEVLDDIVTEGIDRHPLQEQRDQARSYRNIGLGFMGLADALIKLKIVYGSNESIQFIDNITSAMFKAAVRKSNELAVIRGAFPTYREELFDSDIMRDHFSDDELKAMKKHGLRNCSLLSIAPTGSIGTMLNVSTGIEPFFGFIYQRETKSVGAKVYDVEAKIVKEYRSACGDGELPSYFIASCDIPWKSRINVQAAAQRHIDTAISSTVNLPQDIPLEEIEKLYLYAWQSKLKGITIFRAGCKKAAILTTKKTKKVLQATTNILGRGDIIECSDELVGKKRKLTSGCGSLHCLTYFDPVDWSLQEVYLSKGSTGGCSNFTTGLSRMISLLCRAGVDVYTIKDQLDSTGVCPSYATRSATKRDTSKGSCCPVAIGNAIVEMYEEMQDDASDSNVDVQIPIKKANEVVTVEARAIECPECGEALRFEGGCNSCPSCGWSKCG